MTVKDLKNIYTGKVNATIFAYMNNKYYSRMALEIMDVQNIPNIYNNNQVLSIRAYNNMLLVDIRDDI